MEFGEKLKKEREAKGMTQQTLADQLYVTRQAVSRWECGARYPDLMTTKCIASILGVSIDSLVSADEMKDFSEKQALLESYKQGKVMTAVYALATILSFFAFIPYFAKLLILIFGGNSFASGLQEVFCMTQMIGYAGVVVVAVICTKASYQKNIDGKYAGYLGCFFYALSIIDIVISNIYYTLDKQKLEPDIIWGGVFSVLWCGFTIFITGMYFIKKKNKLVKMVYLVNGIILVYEVANFIQQVFCYARVGEWSIYNMIFNESLADLFVKSACIVAMIVQAMILERKRKRHL